MTLEGRVVVSARCRGGRLADVRVHCERPLLAGRLLRGRRPAEVLALLPGLFAICGRSQAVVAAAALDAATGVVAADDVQRRRARELAAETLAEHSFRLLLDWPQLCGVEPEPVLLAQVRSLLVSAAESGPAWVAACDSLLDLATRRLLGTDADAWLGQASAEPWLDWARGAATPTARTLAALAGMDAWPGRATRLLEGPGHRQFVAVTARSALSDPAFAAAPLRDDAPAECGPLARGIGHPALAALARRDRVAARAFARLAEFMQLLRDDSCTGQLESSAPGPGCGAAAAEMARGLLTHAVRLEDGRVVQYVIVAPTEWNFHSAGPLFDTLDGRPVRDADGAHRALSLAAATLDPCVTLEVRLQDA